MRSVTPLKWLLPFAFVAAALVLGAPAKAQQMPNPYGAPVSLENAKKAADLAVAEAHKNNWNIAVAIVNPDGGLIYFEKLDNTQNASGQVAINKAKSAAIYKRPTKAFEDQLAAGGDGVRVLRLEGAIPVEGGVPLVMDGKIVGAIGVSGATSAQDLQCANAGAQGLK